MSSAVCIITARGGSKRIPRKNIKEFCGKPIIAYSIEAALESGLFDEVMVSTDDEEIADVSRSYGANVPFMRSAETSDDYATTNDVLTEVLAEYERRGRSFDIMCCLYPTAPFVNAEELKEGFSLLDNQMVDSVTPVTSFDFPPQRGFLLNKENMIEYAYPQYAMTRSQDLPQMVHDCGRFYFMKVNSFLDTEKASNTKAMFISPLYVQDIDTAEDWELAEYKYKLLNGMAGENQNVKA